MMTLTVIRQLGEQSLALVASPLLQDADFTRESAYPCSFIINERNVSSASCLLESTLRQKAGLRWKTPMNCGY